MRLALPLLLAPLIATAACQRAAPPANSLDAIDNDLVNGAVADEKPADTLANRALAGAIHVDPAKTGHATPSPAPEQVGARSGSAGPATSTGLATPAAGEGGALDGGSGCLGGLAYGNGWAARLPADLPMHPSAQLQEAAGHDGACQARVVSFTVRGDRGQVLGWYQGKARAAGYSTGRADKGGDWILAGDKGPTTYTIILGPPDHGETPVDYVWTSGG